MHKHHQRPNHQSTLDSLLKKECNKYCADCGMKGPRWASTNLGIFLCQRCAGIHRSLGTHISKVKSIDLDYWTDDLVNTMAVIGNAKAQKVYEWSVPVNYPRPSREQPHVSPAILEQWIRAKYERLEFVNHELLKNIHNLEICDDDVMEVESDNKKKTSPLSSLSTNTMSSSSQKSRFVVSSSHSSPSRSNSHSSEKNIPSSSNPLSNGVVLKNDHNSKQEQTHSLLITDFVDIGTSSNSASPSSSSTTHSSHSSSLLITTSPSNTTPASLPPMSHNNSLLLQQSLSNESNKNSVVTVSTTIGIPAPKPQQNDRELSKQFIMQLYNQPLYRTSPFSNPSLALSSYAIYSPSHGGHPLYIYPSAQFTSTPIGTTTHPFNTTTTTPNAQLPSQYRIFHSM